MNAVKLSVAVLGVGLGMVWVSGCSSADAPRDEVVQSGNLQMELTGAANGNTYQLRNATFDITGPTSTSASSETDPSAPTIDLVLPVGDYSVLLASGWVLQRMDTGGPVNVQASLVSPNPAAATVVDGGTSSVVFSFETDGTIVTIGNGTLSIGISVTDTSATGSCDPLAQLGCAAGEGCYPTGPDEGTCAPAGSGLAGDTCAFLNDCAASLTCADIGNGPECVTLCSLAGSTCTCADAGLGSVGICLDAPVAACSYVSQDCAAGEGCYPEPDTVSGGWTPACLPAGTATTGDPCDAAVLSSCEAGNICVDVTGDSLGECLAVCSSIGELCPTGGTCTETAAAGLFVCL